MDLTDTDVLAALSLLPPRDEHLVILKFWDGKTFAQIAELMGFPHAAEAEAYFTDVVAPQLRSALLEESA